MSEPLLTKRLHVGGLTPSITPADLEHRLSSFGKVKTMDGFGARDALGDPRKFGFVTMEIGAKEFTKCLNVLSGSMWKGAKLRIGEAKPDFRERLAQTNPKPPRPLRRTRRRDYGHPSSTLPLLPLSAAAAASTHGWIVTPSGRVVRPMRMRPERPLEPMRNDLDGSKTKANAKKKRSKQPLVRARRRLIDPTKWDSVYLKGLFLDSVSVSVPLPESTTSGNGATVDKEDTGAENTSCEDGVGGAEAVHEQDIDMEYNHPSFSTQASAETAELAHQTNLKALFGPREDASFSLIDHLDLDLELDTDILGTNVSFGQSQENSHLQETILPTPQSVHIPAAIFTTKARYQGTLDPSLPLVFPPIDSLPHSYGHPAASTTAIHPHATPTCFLFPSTTQIRGLHHLPPSITFTRSPQDTSERIRETWERDKSTLTREWKKAWRDARGNRRGKIGAGSEVGGGY
ncbi:hypothetical protein JVU11DRAFT_1039 [Chiua virens]|nr:hypothetical protein JVU11DRAFT_1039 [Chiua virens]